MRKHAATRQYEVLRVLNDHDKSMTAHAILDQSKLCQSDLEAPTVQPAMAALTDRGGAQSLETIKSFVSCRCGHHAAVPVLAICDDCGIVEEHDGTPLLPRLSVTSVQPKFTATRHILEIHGPCQDCAV